MERRSTLAINRRYTNRTLCITFGHSESDSAISELCKRSKLLSIRKSYSKRYIRIINEVISIKSHFTSGGGIFTRHRSYHWLGNYHMETIFYRILRGSHHINFITHFFRYIIRNLNNHSVRCDIAGIQLCLLIIKIEFLDTCKVITHKANNRFQACLHDERVRLCQIRHTYITHLGQTTGKLKLIRLVLT